MDLGKRSCRQQDGMDGDHRAAEQEQKGICIADQRLSINQLEQRAFIHTEMQKLVQNLGSRRSRTGSSLGTAWSYRRN